MNFKTCLVLLGCLFSIHSISQSCDPDSLQIDLVRASDTDSNIPWELSRHWTFYNPDCAPKNILLLHLVGTYGSPNSSEVYPSFAANNGFHVVSLVYNNDTSAQTACNNSSDPNCHENFRREIIEGQDYSPDVVCDSVNSIYNRLLRLVQYMDVNYPSQGWGQYYTGNEMNWDKMYMSGHSQGGGHIAVIAIDKEVQRVIMFASPNDWSSYYSQVAPWTTASHATHDSAYYSLNNINDLVAQYNWQYTSALNLGEGAYGDTVNVDYNSCPYNYSHNLYSSIDSSGFTTNHGMMVSDPNLIYDSNNVPVFEPVWRYLLGLDCATSSIPEKSNEVDFLVYPNPFRNEIQLNFQSAESRSISIIDSSGKLVFSLTVSAKTVAIDTEQLAEGFYIIQVTDSNGNSTSKKLIK